MQKSGTARGTRYMWNGGLFVLWNHISEIFYEDQACGLQLLPKITYEHIHLTPYSVMNVRLAAQVLSSTVSKVLTDYCPPNTAATAKFCEMMDKFFDIMNVSNTKSPSRQLKPFNAPFTSVDDPRSSWLKDEFLKYFEDWLESIEERPGNFSKKAKVKMFISQETYKGIKITVNSMIELTKFLIVHKVSYVLTERLCQDPLENYFGKQRRSGARKDNSSLYDFGYNDNTIRNQKVFKPITSGNVRAEDENFEIDTTLVPFRKKVKHNNP